MSFGKHNFAAPTTSLYILKNIRNRMFCFQMESIGAVLQRIPLISIACASVHFD